MQQTYETNYKNIKKCQHNMLYKQMQNTFKNVKNTNNKKTCTNNATNFPNK